MADITTLVDDFSGSTIDPVWGIPTTGYQATQFSQSGGALRYIDHGCLVFHGATYDWANLSGTRWEVEFAEYGPELKISFGVYPARAMDITFSKGQVYSNMRVYDGNGTLSGSSGQIAYGEYRFFRLFRRRFSLGEIFEEYDSLILEVSQDGEEWTYLNATFQNSPGTPDTWTGFVLNIEFGGALNLLDVQGITVPELEEDPDPDPDPIDYEPDPDPFDRDAEAPERELGKTTLLEFVREFSAQVRRPVRVSGVDTVYMIPLNNPMIGGLTQSDAVEMYSDTTLSLSAEEMILRTRTGNLVMEGAATMVTNDARLITTGWRIPYRLPVYSLKPSPVKRVSLTFTPTEFSASVDFHLPAVPYGVGRGE